MTHLAENLADNNNVPPENPTTTALALRLLSAAFRSTRPRPYDRQCAAARQVAHEYFDLDKVLANLLGVVT